MNILRVADKHDDRRNNWIKELDQRRGKNISAVSVANKNARIAYPKGRIYGSITL
ncbi:hypothetical protein ACTL6P_22960 [Endozoicomonas acroporae]|uniref:hypothetical protein n=1 Tax=Endozoicomonas acroporae TaxID=1701104 RepID=UPI0015E089F7|nr:hypothetical protein [Endozoicomonas acroporae]